MCSRSLCARFAPATRHSAGLRAPQSDCLSAAARSMGVAPPMARFPAMPMMEQEKAGRRPTSRSEGLDEFVASAPPAEHLDLSYIGANIDWDNGPDRLRVGDLSGLDPSIV